MNIAVIQARGGSKRIPCKNIKEFLGRPIITYSIGVALSCLDIFDHVIVSTDSEEIANVAKATGAEVPFMRPEELANDYATTADVVVHAIERSQDIYGEDVDNICCIYATAPFLRAADIRSGYELLRSNDVGSVFPVSTYDFSVFRAQRIAASGHLEMIWPEYELSRSNDLPEAYHDAGQFYWLRTQRFLRDRRIYATDSLPLVLPRVLVQDIDTLEDWETAEVMYEICKERGIL